MGMFAGRTSLFLLCVLAALSALTVWFVLTQGPFAGFGFGIFVMFPAIFVLQLLAGERWLRRGVD
jgi:hypothetical protein